jgi:hypothetical protein
MNQFYELINSILEHENLASGQTPFRITNPKMAKWTSMFDDTLRSPLDPNAKKPKGRENFLYVPEGMEANVPGMVREQFRRYEARNPSITLEKAVKIFDQTGADSKLSFLKERGYDPKDRLSNFL